MKTLLLRLQPRIACNVTDEGFDSIVASHAGYIGTTFREVPTWHFKPWLYGYIDESIELQKQVGYRGGINTHGSVLWADFDEMKRSRLYMKSQVVGHTPQKTIVDLRSDLTLPGNCICVDTFSLNQFYNPIGDGSMLLYKDNNFEVIENLEWLTGDYSLKRLVHFT